MKDSTSTVQNASKRRRDRIIFACVIYLLIVVLVMTPVTLSSYVSTATGSDSATVAKLEMGTGFNTGEITVGNVKLVPGRATQIIFVVTSNSEVTMAYDINVMTNGDIPITGALSCSCTSGNGVTYPFAFNAWLQGGVMPYGNQVHTYTLTINVPEGLDAVYAGELQTIKVSFWASQVD